MRCFVFLYQNTFFIVSKSEQKKTSNPGGSFAVKPIVHVILYLNPIQYERGLYLVSGRYSPLEPVDNYQTFGLTQSYRHY